MNYERDNALIRRADPEPPALQTGILGEGSRSSIRMGTKRTLLTAACRRAFRAWDRRIRLSRPRGRSCFLYVSPAARGWGDQYRVIPMDGRAHTPLADLDGTWKGESIGHWEGDTLVVDTIGFNDTSWLDYGGYFHSENMHVIERLRREGNTLTWQATVEDPDVLMKPWAINPRVQKLNPDPKATLAESLPCVERDLSHLVTKEHH